jgi:CheY-like chemotaxis protein/anti-sigma regulatory factor (Ser/Thr protein kinase)
VDWDIPRHVLGDPNRLRQILYNLISNAIKFTANGEVRVRVQKDDQTASQDRVLFTVTDTGVGISKELQHAIFESFVQADAGSTRQYGGVGLGLSISKRLVDQMGGRIWVISEPGKGSSFFFTVRLPEPETDQAGLPLDALQGLKALVVDDNPTNRLLLTEQLAAWGLSVAEAESGPLGLQMLYDALGNGDGPFDVLLLDCRMPDIDGFETAQRIRADKQLASLPVLLLTSDSRPGQNLRASRLGLQGCLPKPVRAELLRDRLLDIAAQREPADGSRPTLGALSILLAEDDPGNQHVLASNLNSLHCQVDVASNGLAAVERFMYKRYDAVLMDLHLPGMDGVEAARTIREWEEEQHLDPTPIIALSADVIPELRHAAINAGCNAFVTKPARRNDLLRVINSVTQ